MKSRLDKIIIENELVEKLMAVIITRSSHDIHKQKVNTHNYIKRVLSGGREVPEKWIPTLLKSMGCENEEELKKAFPGIYFKIEKKSPLHQHLTIRAEAMGIAEEKEIGVVDFLKLIDFAKEIKKRIGLAITFQVISKK